MKWLKQTGLFSPLLFSACAVGPRIPTCVVLEDLKTQYCIPFDSSEEEFKRPVEAGDYCNTPIERGIILRWIASHRK